MVYYLPRIVKATGRAFGGLDSSHIVELWPWHLPQTGTNTSLPQTHTSLDFGLAILP